MSEMDAPKNRHLVLDSLVPNEDLARRLPLSVARHFHAVPVAEERGVLTVVMADPEDQAAYRAVADALGSAPFIVRADRALIDSLIGRLWSDRPAARPRYLVYEPTGARSEALWDYARRLARLTGAELDSVHASGAAAAAEVLRQGPCDLLLCSHGCESLARRIICGATELHLAECLSTSLLVVPRHRWPLCRILLAVLEPAPNETGLAWVRSLAKLSEASVTALAVLPPVPELYSNLPGIRQGLTQLLATDTLLGREMRRIAQLLVDWGIDGRLRLRQGPVNYEVQLEADEGDYDLIILCAETSNRLVRAALGEVVRPLLRWAERPVLISNPGPVGVVRGCDGT